MSIRCRGAGVQGCRGATVQECLGARACGARSVTATAKFSFARTGRADSIEGHRAMPAAESEGPFDVGSCDGQCGFADSETAGSRQVASHHARAGAAAPTSNAMTTIGNRFTDFSISCG